MSQVKSKKNKWEVRFTMGNIELNNLLQESQEFKNHISNFKFL